MVDLRDFALFLVIAAGGLAVVVGAGAVPLQGSTTGNVLCSVPGVSGLEYCSGEVTPSTQYKLTTNLVVNSAGEDGQFKYKTVKDDAYLSFGSTPDLSVVGANDVVVDYTLLDDGVVIASDRKRLGNIEAPGTKDVTFTSDSLRSGEYNVRYVIRSEYCGVVGSIIGDCSSQKHLVDKTVEIPKLPLGEY